MNEEPSTSGTVDSDDDDPVIKEIPVYLSKRLQDQLYLFQYPLRPNTKETPLNVKKCYVKPENQACKLEVQLNTESHNFDVGKAEDIARRLDGPSEYRKKGKETLFENNMLDTVEYVSSKAVEDSQNYGIGVFNGREFHITPLKGILRLNPYYPHLDKGPKKKQESKQKDDGDDEDEEAAASSSKAQQVTVKFSRGSNNEKVKKVQENSYKKIVQKNEGEAWISCNWHPEKTELSELEKIKLFSEDTKSTINPKDAEDDDPVDYIRRLVPEDQEQAVIKPSLPENVVSYSSLRSLPLIDQCKLILKDAKMVSFQQLQLLLTGCEGLTAENLLKILPQVAVLVRGNWVIKSEIVYPSNTFSAISGVPAEFMCRARDYILILFTKSQYVERRKVASIIRVPAEEIKEIFTSVSKLRHNKGWELYLQTDTEFINKYPEAVQRQNLQWEQRELQLNDFFIQTSVTNKESKRRKSKSVSEDTSRGIKRDAISSDTDSGTEKNKIAAPGSRRNKRPRKSSSTTDQEL